MREGWWRWLMWVVVLAGCGSEVPSATSQASRLLMGTLVNITVWHDPSQPVPAGEGPAMQAAFEEIARIEALMSSQRPDSAVSRINQAPRNQWLPLDGEIGLVLDEAVRVQERSDGAFDPGLEPITRLWGFSRDPPADQPPPTKRIADWLASRQEGERVRLRQGSEGREILLAHQGMGLDLGGIAKGYAVDRAMAVLKSRGFGHAIVDGGGNLLVAGSKGGTAWRIGIQHPRQANQVVAATSIQGDMAVVTSGDYERFFLYQGQRYHHILDPRAGLPSTSGLMAVTIRHPSAMTADALSTAVFVLGLEKAKALLATEPGAAALLLLANGARWTTPGFPVQWLVP